MTHTLVLSFMNESYQSNPRVLTGTGLYMTRIVLLSRVVHEIYFNRLKVLDISKDCLFVRLQIYER